MRSKLMIMSAAALLAGTMMAAGQGMPGKSMQGPAAGGGQQNSVKPSGQMQDLKKGRAPGGPQIQGKTSGQGPRDETQRDVSRPTTNGQAPRGDQERTQGQSTRDKDDSTQGQTQRGQEPQKGDAQRRGETEHQGGSSNTTVNLTTEQRTKVRETVLAGSNAPRASNVTFAVNVGTVVPRTVKVVEVPEPLIEIHPEWRGFRYFVYNDEIIIVEPDSLRIVAVVVV